MTDRKGILLRAAYDILTKGERSHHVLSMGETMAFYDGTMCDGYCLREDIALELNIEDDTDPLEGEAAEEGMP